MEGSVVIEALTGSLWVGVLISAPLLGVALVVGVGVGVLQALTSVQEMTLTFVPKLFAIVFVFSLVLEFMAEVLVDHFLQLLNLSLL